MTSTPSRSTRWPATWRRSRTRRDIPSAARSTSYDARIYDHQLPGGMTGTFRAQLAQHGMEERFDAVLEEIPRVREELGYPVSATPFSQFIGTQALMNIL